MNQFLEVVSHWNGLGQALFFLFVLSLISGTITSAFKYIAICIRGWPEEKTEENDE